MANRISQAARWGATYKVAGSSWTPGAFAGFWLIDAGGTRFRIVDNTTDTLFLASTKAPDVGVFVQYSSPGWTANQFRNTASASSFYVDSTGKQYLILQNTTDTLVTPFTTANPTVPPAFIVQGGVQVAKLTGVPTPGQGVWSIVEDDGTVDDTWTSNTGAVTATDGGDVLASAQVATRRSQAIDTEGIELLSIIAGFLTGTPSTPSGTLNVYVNNSPGPQLGANEQWEPPGPPTDDPGWAKVKVSKDGAASAAGAAIADSSAHLVVMVPTPVNSQLYARWLMLEWVPAGSPGTGDLTTRLYGYGAS